MTDVRFLFHDNGPATNEWSATINCGFMYQAFAQNLPALQEFGEAMVPFINADQVYGGNTGADFELIQITKLGIEEDVPLI